MRSFFFMVGFWWVSFLYVLLAALLALVPGRKGVRWAVKRYSKRMVQLMKLIGIVPEARGRERLPPAPFIIAPKHSSYGGASGRSQAAGRRYQMDLGPW